MKMKQITKTFNRTIMELKFFSILVITLMILASFNRTIMELKYENKIAKSSGKTSF